MYTLCKAMSRLIVSVYATVTETSCFALQSIAMCYRVIYAGIDLQHVHAAIVYLPLVIMTISSIVTSFVLIFTIMKLTQSKPV